MLRFQTRAVLSHEHEINLLLLPGKKTTSKTQFPCSLNLATSVNVATFQRRTVLSYEEDAIARPFGLKLTQRTPFVCPSIVANFSLVATSKSSMSFEPPAARSFPSGEKANPVTPLVCISAFFSPVAAS
eukprot:Lithocolla_globosa_v1_NODE_5577_length_1216_cov_4.110250.p2 type:complete len:129 gc:universal NODE_5577_length_1216_cov_4.110250:117-503(+)